MSSCTRLFRADVVLIAALLGCGQETAAPAKAPTEGVAAAPAVPAAAPPATCDASAAWISAPNPPAEIGGGVAIGDETNCQFQQFAWQWFLSLVSPAPNGERNFETFPVFQPGVADQCATNAPTGRAATAKALFVRTSKSADDSTTATMPEDIQQATGEALYDQAGNVVLYNVRYSPNECQATSAGFQPNTMELKTSWRVMAADDPTLPSYYTLTTDVDGFTGPQTLALVGFHLVINTKNHPEFVWATFEHASNAPDCQSPAAAPASGWSFTSAAAAACLAQGGVGGCSQYAFNTGVKPPPGLTSTPTEVCRVYPDGTDAASMTGGNNNATNTSNIDQLNTQLVGPSGYLTQLPASDPMAVWKNYFLVGSLWTNGGVGSVESSPGTVQRGSLELANLTMETFFQDPAQNCFTCHQYDPSTPLAVSHIVDDLLPSSVTGLGGTASVAPKGAETQGAGAAGTAPAAK